MEFKILDMIQEIRTPILDSLMCMITKLGDAGAIWIILAVILLLIPKTRKTGAIVVAALAVDIVLCNGILKPFIGRIRPCDINTSIQLLVARPDDFFIPSGHTAASFATVAALYFAGEKMLWKPALILSCFIAFFKVIFVCALSNRYFWEVLSLESLLDISDIRWW